MTWIKPASYPKRYGWKTAITAPGPKGSEMFRNLKRIQKDPLPFLMETWKAHGDVVQFPIPFPTYLVNSPDGARDVMVAHNKIMGKRTLQYGTLSIVTGNGLLTAEAEVWKPHRRMLQPAFHKEMIAMMDEHVDRAMASLDARWTKALVDGEAVIDLDEEMMRVALEIVGDALFGIDLSDEAKELTEATLVALHEVIARAQNPLALPLGIPTPSNRRMNHAVATLDRAVERIIDNRRKTPLPAGAPIRDMLDVLLDPEAETPLTTKQVRDEMITFIVAGHETVASGLTWTWDLLSRNHSEADQLAQDPTRAAQVFDEALRLYPPAWVITRRALEDVEIDGHHIPKNSMIIVSPWLHHRHPDMWDSAEEFNSERFAGSMPQRGYLPFGAGPRLCIGREMARVEGAQIIAHIGARYAMYRLVQDETPIEASVTLRPIGGLPMRITRR